VITVGGNPAQPGEVRLGPKEWAEHIAAVQGPQLIVGGPGTGKTEFLVRRAAHLIEDDICRPEEIIVVTFSRRSAADLRERILTRLGTTVRGIDAGTYHSFALRLLEAHAFRRGWSDTPMILSATDHQRLVADLLTDTDPADWSPAYRPMLGTRTFAAEVADFLLRCREQLIGPDELEGMADRHHWHGLPEFFRTHEAALRTRNQVDYGMLLAEAVALLELEEVRQLTNAQYRYALVDEFQDTTSAQSRMLDVLVGDHRNITAAADPYQSIYSFRGADVANVYRFPETFRDAAGDPARRIVLTTSHRVPATILDAAVRVTQHDLPGAAGPVTPAAPGGSVEVYRFDQQTEEAEWIASEITRLHIEQRIPFGRMGVFVRSKRRLTGDLSRALERRAVPHDRPDSRLVDQPAVRFVHDVVVAATGADRADTDRAVRRILLGHVFRASLGSLQELERHRARTGAGWAETIRTRLEGGTALADLLAEPSWATSVPAVDGLWRLWEAIPQIVELVTADDMAFAGAWAAYAGILEAWARRVPEGTLLDHVSLTHEEDFEASPVLRHRIDDERLTVTTLHQSKGLELDVVFIADAVEGVFPDLRSRDSLLGARALNPHVPTDPAGYLAFRLREERRLAYTAMTRATRRVVWTATAAGFDEGHGIPSRFLALVAGTATVSAATERPPRERPPITAWELEALLRRDLADPARSPARRLAALEVLAAAPQPLRAPTSFYGMLEAGPDTGIMGPTVVLSPSQAELYEACPRRYAIERRLGIGRAAGVHAEFGSLVHAALEEAERAALDSGNARATVDEAVALLERRFDPGVFGGAPFARAWLERGREAVRNLYSLWPTDGAPIALELPLDTEIAGTRWVGRADRVEARGPGMAIVDYKTTKYPATTADAERSLQLGFYALAADRERDLAKHRPVVGAEMWYPMKPQKTSVAVRCFDLANLQEVEMRLELVASGIAAEDWPATPGSHCSHCRVRSSCPAWPDGTEAFSA